MELRPPRAKKSHTQSSSAWNAVKTAKYSNHKKIGYYKSHWNTSHTHLERGTYFIISFRCDCIIEQHRTPRCFYNIEHELLKTCAFFPDHHDRSHATSIHKQSLQDRISIFAKACLVELPAPIHNGIATACRKCTYLIRPMQRWIRRVFLGYNLQEE